MATDSFSYTVADDWGQRTAQVSVTINPGTTLFVTASDDSAVTAPGTAVDIPVLANDTASPSLLPLQIEIGTVTQPSPSGTAVISGNQIRYTPASGAQNLQASFAYTAKPSTAASPTAWATVRVNISGPAPPGATPIRRVPSDKRIVATVARSDNFSGVQAPFAQIQNLMWRAVYCRNTDFKTLVRGDPRTGAPTVGVNDHSAQGMIDHAKWQLQVLAFAKGRTSPPVPNCLWWDPESYEDCVHLNVPPAVINDGWSDDHPDDHTITVYYSGVRNIWRQEAVRWQEGVLTKMYDYAKNTFNYPNFEVGMYNIPTQPSLPGNISSNNAIDTKARLFDSGLLSWTGPPLYLSGIGTGNYVSKSTFLSWTANIVKSTRAAFGSKIKIVPVIWGRIIAAPGAALLHPIGTATCNPPAGVKPLDWPGCWKGNAALGYPAGSYMVPSGWLGDQAQTILDNGGDGFFCWRSSGDGDAGTAAQWANRWQEVVDVVKADGRFVLPQ